MVKFSNTTPITFKNILGGGCMDMDMGKVGMHGDGWERG